MYPGQNERGNEMNSVAAVQQQGACEVCEQITIRFEEWSGAYLCSQECEKQYFAGYIDAIQQMLSDETEERDGAE